VLGRPSPSSPPRPAQSCLTEPAYRPARDSSPVKGRERSSGCGCARSAARHSRILAPPDAAVTEPRADLHAAQFEQRRAMPSGVSARMPANP
jgi:hypothetical protein